VLAGTSARARGVGGGWGGAALPMQKFLRLEFIPVNSDLALLVLRVWLGASILWLHGWGKLVNLLGGDAKFADPLGLGPAASLLLTIFAEVGCAALLVLGAWSRVAALALSITMGVAFFIQEHGKLTGLMHGELAFLYLAGFVALFFSGAGKYSVDRG